METTITQDERLRRIAETNILTHEDVAWLIERARHCRLLEFAAGAILEENETYKERLGVYRRWFYGRPRFRTLLSTIFRRIKRGESADNIAHEFGVMFDDAFRGH